MPWAGSHEAEPQGCNTLGFICLLVVVLKGFTMSRAQEEWENFWTELGAVLLVFNFGLSIIGLPWFFFGLPKFVMDYNKLQPSDFFFGSLFHFLWFW